MEKISKLLFVFAFIINQIIFAQDFKEFYLVINSDLYVPEYNKVQKKFLVSEKLPNANPINVLLSELSVINCVNNKEINPNEARNLIRINVTLLDSKRQEEILSELIRRFNQFISYERLENYEFLYTPNDFETLDVSSQTYASSNEQNDLILIRAEDAWELTTGEPYVLIGIADTGFHVDHPELVTEIVGGVGNYDTGVNTFSSHGSGVMGRATAATNNNLGISSIGFNTKGLANAGASVYGLWELSLIGAKVVNASFGGPYTNNNAPSSHQNKINEIVANGTTVVCAAGNGPYRGSTINTNGIYTNESYASRYIYPASYKNVISVSTVGNKNEIGYDSDNDPQNYENWKDIHLTKPPFPHNYDGTNIPINEKNISHQHNDSVDIVVPTFYGTRAIRPSNNIKEQYSDPILGGTSYAAPVVAGTIGLMLSVNFCIDPKEVETILKLTAVVVDTIPQNGQFYGRLGAGRLDAYEAVKMAKDMSDLFGVVEVKDRILYRPWFYKLETAPFKIVMTNNNVSQSSKLKFKARNSIEILSGEYNPSSGGYVDLNIDSTLSLSCKIPSNFKVSNVKNIQNFKNTFNVFPTLVIDNVHIINENKDLSEMKSVIIYNFYGEEVFKKDKINSNKVVLDLMKLFEGIYILKIYNSDNEVLDTVKLIKK